MLTDRSRIALANARWALCSSLAIATALVVGSEMAQAQTAPSGSFQGSGVFASGSGTITPGTGSTTIDITSNNAVIDWTTFDTAIGGGPINFQPSGTTATFQRVLQDFSVLNRIFPTDPSRAVQFNGNVISQIQSSVSPTPGGTVYFYSPGGVIVGSTAVFNVGNLGLTSAAPQVVGGVFEQINPVTGSKFVNFTAANPATAVQVQAGAQINALNNNYVAVVAPVIDQRGTINVNGAAALVSADAATITFNPTGLFDIQVTSGTSGTGTTLFNNGSVTGPAYSGTGPLHRIYAVAVPKNTAITMAIGQGGSLGFNIAGAADMVGNAVVLSAGYDIVAGQALPTPSAGGGTGQTSISLAALNVTSAITARATGQAVLTASSGQTVNYASDVSIAGAQASSDPLFNAVQINSSGAGTQLIIAGNVTVTALDPTLVAPASGFQVTNFAIIDATNGGNISIGGSATLRNDKFNPTGSATPGQARIAVNGGSQLTIGGGALLTAIGTGTGGGSGNGGQTLIDSRDAGSLISISGATTLNASGIGSSGASPGFFGGNATGGVAIIQARSGGDVSITGPVVANASATGGNGNVAGGGSATGGLAQIFARDAGSSVTITGTSEVRATGSAGLSQSGFTGGVGNGGTAIINAQVAASNGISISGASTIDASGFGGSTTNSAAGIGTGGFASVAVSENNTVQFGSTLDIFASGQGGTTSNGSVANGNGGTARLNLFNNGTLTINGNTQLFAAGLTGNGNFGGGVATGGTVGVTSQSGSILDINGFLIAGAGGLGNGSTTAPGTGFGVGGNVTVAAFTNGSIDVSGVIRARAPGVGANGGSGRGGTVTVSASSGGDLIANELNILATAVGSTNTGNGGSATGGTANLIATGAGSTLTITNGNSTGTANLGELEFISAQAFGGQANGSGVGGFSNGGSVNITASNGATLTGPANVGSQGFVRVIARAFAGNANTGATAGGQATGGIINITIDNATFTSADLLPSSFAQGGSATATASGTINGGNAVGGQRNISVRNGATATTSFSGGGPGAQGGNATASGRGGDASGGNASLVVDNATLTLSGPSVVFSQNISGSGGTAGNATAGTAYGQVSNGGTLTVPDDATVAYDFSVLSTAFGPFAGVAGNTQGNVTAGNATLLLQGGTINGPGSISVQANAAAISDQYAQGGTYLGGQASLLLQGGTISSPTIYVGANAAAGAVGAGLTGTGGSATGGAALVQASGTTTNLTGGQIVVEAAGLGGNVLGTGTGGDGTGGLATLRAISAGVLNVSGNAIVTTDGIGGSAMGTASSGAGGNGAGGIARLIGNAGTVVVSGTTQVTSSGSGGNGGSGGASGIAGAGGIGAGGTSQIIAFNNVAGSATVNLGAVTIGTDGTGGFGGAGSSGGGPGGAGGAGTGGSSSALGAAGNGNLTTGNVVATAFGIGGAGGAGGTGATGGTGGAGGQAVGGSVTLGTASFLDNSPTNTGSGTFGTSTENASAFGGNGGAGGSGTTQGIGGRGGAAFDGSAVVLSRGSPVTFNGAVTLAANATGGNGGAGSTAGAGGNATVGSDPVVLNPGGIGVVVTSRFMHPEQPGRLSAGSITGNATASGGSGSTPGASLLANQPIGAEFTNASATINALDLRATAATALAGAAPSTLTLTNATASIPNLTLKTSGTLSLALDTATLNTANLTLSAANFVLPATPPAAYGTINVSNGLSISSQLDFLAYANFVIGSNATLNTVGAISVGDITVNGTLQANAGTTFTAGNISASDVTLQGTTGLTTGTISAAERIKLTAPQGQITTGALQAGDSVQVSASGALSVASASAGIVNPSTNTSAEYNVLLRSLTSVTAGNLAARANIGLASPGTITVGNLSAGGLGVLALAGTGLTTGSISAVNPVTGALTGRIYLANFSMEALGGQIVQNFDPAPVLAATPVAIAGPVTINGAASGSVFQLAATGAVTTGQVTAGGSVDINATGRLTVGNVSAGIVNPIPGQNGINLRSQSDITAGNLAASVIIKLSTPGAITTGDMSANLFIVGLAGTGITAGNIITPQTTTFSTPQILFVNQSMEALGSLTNILAATSLTPVGGPIFISGAVRTGAFRAGSTTTTSVIGPISTGNFSLISGNGGVSVGAVTAVQSVNLLSSQGTIVSGALQAGDQVFVSGNQGVTVNGAISAGLINPNTSPNAQYKVGIISSAGSVSTGTVSAGRDLGIQAMGGITTGDLAGRDVLLLAGSGVSTGAILAGSQTQPSGRLYIGNFSMANSASNVFLPFSGPLGSLPIFNLQPVRIGGAITIGGGVNAGSLYASAAQGISLQAVTTPAATTQIGSGGIIDLDSGGLVTVNGRLAAGHRIDIASRDIDITQTGSLDALGSTGEIQLASNNPNGAFIGDGLTTTSGYMLSNAEYARLKAGEIAVIGDDISGLATDLTIGTLTINASQLYGANGTALFATGNRDTQTPSGILRIAGAVTATGFTATNEVDLLSGTVELEAEKGSLKIDNGSGGLGGQIVIQANNIHVASDAILTRLRADPLYEGHIKELNAPALVQRTDGVLNALNLDLSGSQTVYIQNTGSLAVPAGFVTRLDSNTSSNNNNDIGQVGVRPPEGTEFVINGQIQTDTGIVTGKAAFDLAIASLKAEALANGETFLSDLTLTSTLNGCVIATGVCAFGNADPVAALSSEISVVTNATLDESPVAPAADDSDEGDEAGDEKKDEDDSSDEGSSPIAPPAPLISTRALDGNVNVVEPVSGAGNPALFGSAVDETTVQGEQP